MTEFIQSLKFEYTGKASLDQMTTDVRELNVQLERLAQLSGKTGLRAATQQAQQTAKAINQASDEVFLLRQRLESIGRIAVGVFLARSLGYLTQTMNESISTAFQLEQAIAEIDTISNKARFSTQGWSSELVKLSNAFNIDVLNVAEAAYQTLSNQIGQASEAVDFLSAAGRLSIATVSDMSTSVDALSGILNAYNLDVSEAEAISAKLFITIREGRLRLEDISGSIGNVAILAAQLGISIDELLASIATLTIQGVKTTEAMTGLRGVMLKILRPTEQMREAVQLLGYESGAAAVQSLGLINFLDQIRGLSESGVDGLEEFANAFGRVRAAVGGIGLQKEAKRFRDIVSDMTSNIEEYNQAIEKVEATDAFQVTQEMTEFKNFIIQFIGGTFVTAVANFNRLIETATFGLLDLSKVLAGLTLAGLAGGMLLVVQRAAALIPVLVTIIEATQLYAVATGSATVATLGFSAALAAPFGIAALAGLIGAAAGALVFYINNVNQAKFTTVDFANVSIDAYNKMRAEYEKQLNLGATEAFQAATNEVTRFLTNVNAAQAGLQKLINQHEQIKSEIRDLEQELFQQQLQERNVLGDDQGALNLLLQRAQVVKQQMRDAIAEGSKEGFQDAKSELSSLANQIAGLDDGLNVAFKNGAILSTSQVAAALIKDMQALTREQLAVLQGQLTNTKQELETAQAAVDEFEKASDRAEENRKAIEASKKGIEEFSEVIARTSALITQFVTANTDKIRQQVAELQRLGALGRGPASNFQPTGVDKAVVQELKEFLELVIAVSESGEILRPEIFSTLLEQADELSRKLPLLSPLVEQFAQDEIAIFDQIRGQLNEGNVAAEKWKILVEDLTNKTRALQESGLADLAERVNKIINEQGGAAKVLKEGSEALNILIQTMNSVLQQTAPAVEESAAATGASVSAAYAGIQATQAAAEAAFIRAQQALALAQQASYVASGVAFANSGTYVRRYASGGMGLDTVPAMLSPGEFVVNSRDTAKFMTQLVGMNNTGRTQLFDAGGNVSVGDVNVSLSGVDSPEVVAREIGNQIRRELRRGVLRLS